MQSITQIPEFRISYQGFVIDTTGEHSWVLKADGINTFNSISEFFMYAICNGLGEEFFKQVEKKLSYEVLAEHCIFELEHIEDKDFKSSNVLFDTVCLTRNNQADPACGDIMIMVQEDKTLIKYQTVLLEDEDDKEKAESSCGDISNRHLRDLMNERGTCDRLVEIFRNSESVKEVSEKITQKEGFKDHVIKMLDECVEVGKIALKKHLIRRLESDTISIEKEIKKQEKKYFGSALCKPIEMESEN